MQEIELRLTGRIPSKKNSTIQIMRHGKPLKFPSKEFTERQKEAILQCQIAWLPKLKANRVSIGYLFHRPDNRGADFSNKIESINDMLVKYGFLEDDKRQYLYEYKFVRHDGVDKELPWVTLFISYERNENIVVNDKKLRKSSYWGSVKQQELFQDLWLV